MKINYDHCFEVIIGHEGGWGNDPNDRGNWDTGVIGKGNLKGTKYGIAAHVYPNLDIKNITLADAKAIYKRDYWDRIGADELPAGLDLAAFDSAVNSGVGAARRWIADAHGSYSRLLDLRLAFLRTLPTWTRYGRGWGRRIAELRSQCADLAAKPAAAQGRVLLVPQGGGDPAPWDGKPAIYGGIRLDDALLSQLRIIYPKPGGAWTYGAAPNQWKIWLRDNGDYVIERA